ncbi:MAG TPA: hypothetical protein VGF25_10500 [Thermoleophilaceae bacterium]|jgi:hypothetical protein
MAYSLAVVQPRAARFFGDSPRERERFAVALAAGARRPVLAAVALLAASGLGLVLLEDDRGTGWWVLVALKAALLAAAAALFAYVSWRLWPARLFATGDELPSHRRRFYSVAVALTAIVALEFVLGAAADALA